MLDPSARRRSLERRLQNLQAALESLLFRREALVPSALLLADRCREALTSLSDALSTRWDRMARYPEPKKSESRVRLCLDLGRVASHIAGELIPLIEASRSDSIPVELLPAVIRQVRSADSGIRHVILYSSGHASYSVGRAIDPVKLADMSAPVPRLEHGSEGEFLTLRIPRTERDSALLHSVLLAHEVGHVIDWANGISRQLRPSSGVAQQPDHAYASFVQHWAQEVAADVVSVLLFGPAALLAFAQLVADSGALGKDSPTHPAPGRRFQIMVDVSRELGFTELDVVGPVLQLLVDRTVGIMNLPVVGVHPEPEAQQAWVFVRSSVPQIVEACREAVGESAIFSVQKEWPHVREAARELLAGRPCGESVDLAEDAEVTVSAVEDRIISNAGWLAYLGGLESLRTTVGVRGSQARVDAVLDGLVLKSFEVAEWRRQRPFQPIG